MYINYCKGYNTLHCGIVDIYLPAFSLMAVSRIFSQGVITPRSITLKQQKTV